MLALVKNEASAVVAAEHQLTVTHLPAERQSHLVGGRSHKEVTIDGSHHLMTGPRVAYCHVDGCLTGYRFLAAQAGFHHNIGVGEVHLGHTHLERQGRDVKLGCCHTRPHQMRENERVHIISLVTDGPLVTGRTRDRAHQYRGKRQ